MMYLDYYVKFFPRSLNNFSSFYQLTSSFNPIKTKQKPFKTPIIPMDGILVFVLRLLLQGQVIYSPKRCCCQFINMSDAPYI